MKDQGSKPHNQRYAREGKVTWRWGSCFPSLALAKPTWPIVLALLMSNRVILLAQHLNNNGKVVYGKINISVSEWIFSPTLCGPQWRSLKEGAVSVSSSEGEGRQVHSSLGWDEWFISPGKGQTFQISPERSWWPNSFPRMKEPNRGREAWGKSHALWGGRIKKHSDEILSSYPDVGLYFENKN